MRRLIKGCLVFVFASLLSCRFQDLADLNSNRNFYQSITPAFQNHYDQRGLTYKQWQIR
jgi:hypothetical protein